MHIKSEPRKAKIYRVKYVKHHIDGCIDSGNRFFISAIVYILFELMCSLRDLVRERGEGDDDDGEKRHLFFLGMPL